MNSFAALAGEVFPPPAPPPRAARRRLFVQPSQEEMHSVMRSFHAAQDDGSFTVQMWHPTNACTGEQCPWHPLFSGRQSVIDYDRFANGCWGGLNDAWFEDDLAAETAEDARERLAAEATRERARAIAAEAHRQAQYAQDLAFYQSLGQKRPVKGAAPAPKKLIQAPCKWLYAVPGQEGVFSARPCSECWGHEYTDAKGEFRAPHKCLYIHRGDPEWKAEWDALPLTRDRWRPAALPKVGARFDCLASRAAPVDARPPPSKKKQRFDGPEW